MDKVTVLETLRTIGLVPVLRADSVDKAMALAEAIADGGVTVLEVTMTVPGAIEVMRKLAQQRPDILVGAGTVLDPETARICMLEGKGMQWALDCGVAHGALAMTTPGDSSMATLAEVERLMGGAGAGVVR